MNLSARSAAIRGDDYQHLIDWYWACRLLDDPEILSVSIEDPSGGAFDDILVTRRLGPNLHIQAKSSNHGNVVIDDTWLTTPASPGGKSPLQHFWATYRDLAEPTVLELWTNRNLDHAHQLIGKLRDLKTDRVDTEAMLGAGKGTLIGKARDAWAKHLGTDEVGLAGFLDAVGWKHKGSELDMREQVARLMRLAGLRHDEPAIDLGQAIVRRWVTNGVGTRTVDDIRAAVAEQGLLALDGSLLLVVNAIDRLPTATQPNVSVDFVDHFEGSDSFTRKVLRDPGDWDRVIVPKLDEAARALASYGVRRVHVAGAMRLPIWFAVGRSLPQVQKWTLTIDQVGSLWDTGAAPEKVTPRLLKSVNVDGGPDLAVAVSLTTDVAVDVERYLAASALPVGKLIVLAPEGSPAPDAVPSDAWALGWTRSAREAARSEASQLGAPTIHLFMACPAGAALMLGHQWNVMPTTTMYEYVSGTYVPTLSIAGL